MSTQTGHESPDMAFNAEKMTVDKHCYECKVRYRDPKPQDLVMYLHAWKYKVSVCITTVAFKELVFGDGDVDRELLSSLETRRRLPCIIKCATKAALGHYDCHHERSRASRLRLSR